MRLRACGAQPDAEDDVDEECVTASRVVGVRRDTREESRAEVEEPRELLSRRERLRRVEVAACLVVDLARLEVARDQALRRAKGVSER